MDAKWNATKDNRTLGNITRPSDNGTIVTDAVGLLNIYEYQESFRKTDYSNGYLNNGLYWFSITAFDNEYIRSIINNGDSNNIIASSISYGIRPSINLKSDVKIVSGDGTKENPYRLKGDNDNNLSGVKLNTRYSGEYVKFGSGENNLYMIVSHEREGLTKITSAEPLKDSGIFKTINFGNDVNYSSTNTIGTFLNGEYLTSYVSSPYTEMIEDNTTWYLGTIAEGGSYKLAKYTDTNATSLTTNLITEKVGLLRLGELMAGQINSNLSNKTYWLLNSNNDSSIWIIGFLGNSSYYSPANFLYGIRPALNLKQNVIITSGDGTKENPFEIELG